MKHKDVARQSRNQNPSQQTCQKNKKLRICYTKAQSHKERPLLKSYLSGLSLWRCGFVFTLCGVMKQQLWFLAIVLTASLALLAAQEPGSRQVEWLYYGGDPANTKYSPLADITVQNVERLQVAWQWKHWETALGQYGTTPGFFESTPLMIDGVLYVTTPYNSIAALDAETGKELWRFDGVGYKLGHN